MAYAPNNYQQVSLDDSFNNSSNRTRKFIANSWAESFSKIVFPAINEDRFSVLYSDNTASRPNNPINAVIGALILKEMHNLTDDELFGSIMCDIRYQYALHTTSFTDQPFSDRTFSRFRERLYRHMQETGEDLLHEEMESLAQIFSEYLKLNPSVKRMDSLMVSSSCKKMTRLEIIYTCVSNVIKRIKDIDSNPKLHDLVHYQNEEDKNTFIYHRKSEEISDRLQSVIDDGVLLINELNETYHDTEEYVLLKRVIQEQTEVNKEGKIVPADKMNISPSSLQNPSDPDATYRYKSGKANKGYAANIVETTDGENSIITSYDYDVNSRSDSEFCKKTLTKLGKQIDVQEYPHEEKMVVIADGAYASVENMELAEENNIELITTSLIGRKTDVIRSEFVINEENRTVEKCPAGKKPYKTSYYKDTGTYRASFNKKDCINCPHREHCGSKIQKKSAYVLITTKAIQRASYLKKIDQDEYIKLQRKRNGIEGIPSILRRRYNVDNMPVRGLLRSKIFFSFKIGAINAKRVIMSNMREASSSYLKYFMQINSIFRRKITIAY